MQLNISLIELDKSNSDHLSLMYTVRTHPEVDSYLRGAPPASYADHVRYLTNVGSHKRFYLIQLESLLCGYCQLTISNDQVEIGMAIHPDHCNKGIGSKSMPLLLARLQQNEETKNKSLILFVKKDNLRAIALYSKYGFRTVGKENEYGEYLMKKGVVMKPKIAIYLAGSIKKDHEKSEESFWTDEDMDCIKIALYNYEISFLNPAFRTDDLSDQRSVFGRDMLMVFSSNFVFVDARNRRGLGVGAEMMWSKVNKIPLITWAPKNSHYNKDKATILDVPVANFIHPFVESLSDKVVENLEEGAKWIHFVTSNPTVEIKGIQSIGSAMQHYKDSQLHRDRPMRELISSSEELEKRMHRSHPQVVLNHS